METPVLTEYVVSCAQCGGELHPDEGQIFLTCPYCSSTVYLDKSQVVFHWYLAPTLDEQKARGALASWMAGNQTVKDLDQKASVQGGTFEYFPLWYFKRRRSDRQEEIILEPAAATSVSEISSLKIPAGDLRKYNPSLDSQAHPPSVPLETALGWLSENNAIPADEIIEKSLVHLPLYTFKYTYRSQTYTALVEAGTGGIFANIFPAKAEMPYRLVGGLTAAVFLCLATAPLIGAAIERGAGAALGLLVFLCLVAIAAPLLFALAARVAAKV
jgi:DNA-directed RNA polymerase subunit RPC12/RpoP